MKVTIAIADDHQLFLKSLSLLIENFQGFAVIAEALNGEILIRKLAGMTTLPEIILIDVTMPVMNGPATVASLSQIYPEIRLAALSMKDDDQTVIQMIRAGCCAYLLKDMHPNDLEKALMEIHSRGYYNADTVNRRFNRLLSTQEKENNIQFSVRELEFIELAASDLTYRQIADKMHLAERTVDGYRESLFQKLNVQSRVGMVLEALRKGMIKL